MIDTEEMETSYSGWLRAGVVLRQFVTVVATFSEYWIYRQVLEGMFTTLLHGLSAASTRMDRG